MDSIILISLTDALGRDLVRGDGSGGNTLSIDYSGGNEYAEMQITYTSLRQLSGSDYDKFKVTFEQYITTQISGYTVTVNRVGDYYTHTITLMLWLNIQPNYSTSLISADINWTIKGSNAEWSSASKTTDDEEYRLSFLQLPKTTEGASFSNLTATTSQTLPAEGLTESDTPYGLFAITANSIQDDNVWLEFEGDPQLVNDFKYTYTRVGNRYTFVATSFPANTSKYTKDFIITVLGRSEITGKVVEYYTPALTLNRTQAPVAYNSDLSISFPNELTGVIYKGDELYGSLNYTSLTSNVTVTSNDTWCSVSLDSTSTVAGVTTNRYKITINKNTTSNNRQTFITISSKKGATTFTNYVDVLQLTEPNPLYCSTWEDISLVYDSETPVEIKIADANSEEEIFLGTAYPINGACNLNLKTILNNYVSNDIKFLQPSDITTQIYTTTYKDEPLRHFEIYVNGSLYQVIHLLYNWTFDNKYYNNLTSGDRLPLLNNPINNVIDGRQYIFLDRAQFSTALVFNRTTYSFRHYNPPIVSYTDVNVSRPNSAFLTNCMRLVNPSTSEKLDDIDELNVTNGVGTPSNPSRQIRKYKVCWCGKYKYCLYYINKYGGTDWYLFGDVTKENRNITNSNALFDRQNTQYSKDVKQSWKLNTELLTDEQSKLMPDMIESTCLYLHNLETDEIVPVNVTDTTYIIKSYRNNGRKMFNYTLTVEAKETRNIYC